MNAPRVPGLPTTLAELPDSIAKFWAFWRAQVVPATEPDAQVANLRMAFFSGAAAMFDMQAALADDSLTEAAAVARMCGLKAELDVFTEEMQLRINAQKGRP